MDKTNTENTIVPIEMIWEKRGLFRKFRGVVSDADLKHSMDLIAGDERLDSIRYIISDYTDAQPDASIDYLAVLHEAGLSSGIALINPHIKDADVATDPMIVSMIINFANARVSPKLPHGIFSTVEEARQWVEKVD